MGTRTASEKNTWQTKLTLNHSMLENIFIFGYEKNKIYST
jgi:hypothetical protein